MIEITRYDDYVEVDLKAAGLELRAVGVKVSDTIRTLAELLYSETAGAWFGGVDYNLACGLFRTEGDKIFDSSIVRLTRAAKNGYTVVLDGYSYTRENVEELEKRLMVGRDFSNVDVVREKDGDTIRAWASENQLDEDMPPLVVSIGVTTASGANLFVHGDWEKDIINDLEKKILQYVVDMK